MESPDSGYVPPVLTSLGNVREAEASIDEGTTS